LTPPASANFIPALGSPLIGGASPVAEQFSSVAANSVTFSATDTAKTRLNSPTDIGAYER
jgi:hypothetical protein